MNSVSDLQAVFTEPATSPGSATARVVGLEDSVTKVKSKSTELLEYIYDFLFQINMQSSNNGTINRVKDTGTG